MRKAISSLSIIILFGVLTGCGQKFPDTARYTAIRVNDNNALLIDQKTGKVFKVGVGPGWNEHPREIKINWKGNK